jgi:hypothetical protein
MYIKERKNIANLQRHPWELSRADIILDLLKDYLPSAGAILDIGCGDLFFAKILIQHNKNCVVYCLDIAYSDQEVNNLNSKHERLNVGSMLKFRTGR